MICPYNHLQVKQVLQDSYDYDEDGKNTVHTNVLSESRQCGECAQEQCAVWYDGKCHYYGDTVNVINISKQL